MTKDHEILFGGKMRRAIDFIDNYENVHKVKYSGEPLYNVKNISNLKFPNWVIFI